MKLMTAEINKMITDAEHIEFNTWFDAVMPESTFTTVGQAMRQAFREVALNAWWAASHREDNNA